MLEDSQAYPMAFALGLTFDQPIDPDRLLRAVNESLHHHPLLSSTVDSRSKNWILNEREVCFIEDQKLTTVLDFDLQKENGLRVVLNAPSHSSGKTEIGFVIHHACTDGLGAMGFIADVAANYSNDLSPDVDLNKGKNRRRKDCVDFLRTHRRAYGRNRLLNLLRWPIDILGMLWTYEIIFNRPHALQPSATPPPTDVIVQHLQIALDESSTKIVKQFAKSKSQTINDRIIEASFLAIDQWFHQFAPAIDNPLIRLMIPVNLRNGIASKTNTASNMVAMVNLDRRPRRRRLAQTEKASQSFRNGLRWEMGLIKRTNAALTANRFLQLQRSFLGGWPMLKQAKRCLATCPVSNLGVICGWNSETEQFDQSKPFVFGAAAAKAFRVIGPLRQNSNLMIVVSTFKNRLHLDLTFNPRCLDLSQAQRLAELLRDSILEQCSETDERIGKQVVS